MGLIDRVLGGKRKEEGAAQHVEQHAAASTSSPAPSASEIVHDTPSSSFGPPSISSSSLSSSSPLSSMMSPQGGAPSRLYDPYEGISQAVGGKKQLFKLPEQPEFLFEEEASVRRRGWGENLQFYTGLGYITGAGAGVLAGGYRFITTKSEVQGTETLKLKTNRALNSVGMYARPLANSCGILGLFYSCADSIIYNQLDQSGLPESMSSIFAGALTGALFRAPRGPRQALVAGGVGAVVGAGMIAARSVFPSL